MNARAQAQNTLDLQVDAIQYLPSHRCPMCGAEATTDRRGNWYVPYQDFFGSALQEWQAHMGYVYFACECRHQDLPTPGARRVARLGDAILSLDFADHALARQIGLDVDILNSKRIAQAVGFLARFADPLKLAGCDALKMILYEVSAGESPDTAYQLIKPMLAGNLPVWTPSGAPVPKEF